MNRRIQALIAATSVACVMAWSTLPTRAADPVAPGTPASPASPNISKSVSDQVQVRNQTQRVTGELDGLILEYDRNGIGDGADVQVLKNIRTVLATLSAKDMEQVITLLDNAKGGDPHAVTRALANAFSAQSGISGQLRQLIIEYQRQQDLADISLQFLRLADGQNENMKTGTSLYRSTNGAVINDKDVTMKAQLQVQQSQQQSIHDEAKVLLDRLSKLAATADPTMGDRLKAVIADAQKEEVEPTLLGAADDLKASHLLSAVGKERTARDALRDLARLVAPTKDPLAALKDARDNLKQAESEENYIAKQSPEVAKPEMADGDAKDQLDQRHSDNLDKTDNIKKDIANLVPEAVPDLKAAEDKMQESRKALAEGKGQEAKDKADDANKEMAKATDKLTAEIARLAAAEAADTKIAKAKALKDQIVALRLREELLQTDTGKTKEAEALGALAPRQTVLTTTLQDLQKQAATDFPDVATVLGDAGKQMDLTQDSLATSHNGPEAVRNEGVAIDDLKKAEKLLDDTIAKLEAVKAQLAKLEKARDKVAKAADDQDKAQMDTKKQAEKEDKQADPAADKALAQQQDKVSDDIKDAKNDVADADPDANKPVADAQKQADQAANDLKQPNAKAADPAQKNAGDDLKKALKDMDQKIADAKKQLGMPDDNADKLADAQQKVDDALNKLDQPDDPMQKMQQDQQQVAQDLAQQPQTPDTADAQKAADKAADDLKKGDLPQAAKDMDAAQKGMQKAMAAKPDAGKPDAAKMAATEKKQADLQQQVAAMQAGDPPPTDAAAGELAKAGDDDAGALPDAAAAAMAAGQQDAADAAAQAGAGKDPGAAKAAAKAALQQAKAQIAAAQAGAAGQAMGGPPGGPPGPDGPPGPNGPPGQGKEDPNKKGQGDRTDAKVSGDSKTGGQGANGQSAYVGLPARDRDAIKQSGSQKYPEEYGPMIEQYLKNLSDQPAK